MAIIFVNSGWSNDIECYYTITDGEVTRLSNSSFVGGTESKCYSSLANAIAAASESDTIWVYNSTATNITGGRSTTKEVYQMAGESISYDENYKASRKTVSIEAYRIEASSPSSVSGNITLNIHCTGSPLGNKDVNSQLKVTGSSAEFTVSNGAVLVFTAENAVQTPFTNGKTLTVDGATITVLGNVTNTGIVGGTFTSDPGNTSACSTYFQNSSLLIANAFLVNKSQNLVTITGSTFEVGTWSGSDSERTLAPGLVSNNGTITLEGNSIFRAGAVTNSKTITVDGSTFEATSFKNGSTTTFTSFTNNSTVSISGTVSNSGKSTASTVYGIQIQDSKFEAGTWADNSFTGSSVSNSGTITVEATTDKTASFRAGAITNNFSIAVENATFNAASLKINNSTASLAAIANSTVSISGTVSNSGKSTTDTDYGIQIQDSKFEAGTWVDTSFTGSSVSNSGTITVEATTDKTASFRAGAITNSRLITVNNSTFEATSFKNESTTTFTRFTNNSTVSISGTVSNSGKSTTDTDYGIQIQDSKFEAGTWVDTSFTGSSVSNSGTITVEATGANRNASFRAGAVTNNSNSTITVEATDASNSSASFYAGDITNNSTILFRGSNCAAEVGSFTNNGGNTTTYGLTVKEGASFTATGLVNQSGKVVGIDSSTFEVGAWTGSGNDRTFSGGAVTNTGTITVTNSTFRAGNITNNGNTNSKITFSGSSCTAEVGVFTNTSGSSTSANAGLVVESGASLTATDLTNAQSKFIKIMGAFEVKGEIFNSGEISVSGSEASLSAVKMDMSQDGSTKRGVLTVTNGASASFSGLLGLNTGGNARKITVTGGATLSAGSIKITMNSSNPAQGGIIIVDAHSLVKVSDTGSISGGTINVLTSDLLTDPQDDTYLVVYGKIDGGVKVSVDNGATQNYSAIDGTSVGNDYVITTQGGKGIWLTKESLETLYVNSTYSATGDNDGHGYGYNAFNNFAEALTVAYGLPNTVVDADQAVLIKIADNESIEDQGNVGWNVMSANNVRIQKNSEADNVTAAIGFASGDNGLFLAAAEGKTITIESGVTLKTTGAGGHADNGAVYLNYQGSNTGTVVVNGTIDAAAAIKIFGNAQINGTLKTAAGHNIVLRAGKAAPHATVTFGTSATINGADWFRYLSGNVVTNNAVITVKGFKYDNQWTDDSDFDDTPATLTSHGTIWTVEALETVGAGHAAEFNFDGGAFNVTGPAAASTNATDAAEIGSNITVNLTNNAAFNVANGKINNAGTINVTNSTVSAASLDNDCAFTVSGTSKLHIGSLDGTITINGGAALTASNISGGNITASGAVTVSNSTISSNTFTATAAGANFTGTNALNGVTLNAAGKTITNSGTLTINAAANFSGPLITAASLNNDPNNTPDDASDNGTVTINVAEGFSGMKKLIDLDGGSKDGNITMGTASGVYLAYDADGHDYWLADVDMSSVYVDSSWTGHAYGDKVAPGKYYGYNAFSTTEAATGADSSTIIVQDGTYVTVTELKGIKAEIGETAGTTLFERGVYGGIRMSEPQAGTAASVEQNIDVSITGGTFMKLVAGGSLVNLNSPDDVYNVSGDTQTVSISGGKFENTVAAGDRLQKGILHRDGDLDMEIKGGTFTSFVAGGMMNVIADAQSGHACIDGDIEMKITGGTFSENSWLYGGNVSSGKSTISANSTINGSVTITVDAAGVTENGIVLSHVVAGSHGKGHIEGKLQADDSLLGTKVVFLGDGVDDGKAVVFARNALDEVVGELWGSSSSDPVDLVTKKINPSTSVVKGDRVLSFMGFNGKLDCANIRAFSKIEIKKRTQDKEGTALLTPINSAVVLDHENFNLSGIDTWEFDCGSTLSGNFINDFSGDTLNLAGFTGIESPQTLMTDTDKSDDAAVETIRNIFNGFGSLDTIKMDGTPVSSKSFEGNAWMFTAGGSNYSLALVTSEETSSMVLTRTPIN